jgi:hypothetical protein
MLSPGADGTARVSYGDQRSNAHRIAENIDLIDFGLTAEDLQAIDALDTGTSAIPRPPGRSSGPIFWADLLGRSPGVASGLGQGCWIHSTQHPWHARLSRCR